ncbi:hypothetical protein A2U01_0102179, partial [Trifolium medium]|nr:hypothetical protein [Trifolium medium]
MSTWKDNDVPKPYSGRADIGFWTRWGSHAAFQQLEQTVNQLNLEVANLN